MSKNINYSIEGLRGIAILCIVMYHMTTRFASIYLPVSFPNILLLDHWGEIFVSIFLIISAFFLYQENDKDSYFSISNYYTHKFWRLWPLYFISITLIFCITRFWILPYRTCSLREYIFNIFFIHGMLGINYVDGAHWYLDILISMIFVMGIIKYWGKEKSIFTYLMWLIISGLLLIVNNQPLTHNDRIPNLVVLSLLKLGGGKFIGIGCIGFAIHMFIFNHSRKYYSGFLILISILWTFYFAGFYRSLGAIIGIAAIIICLKFPHSLLSHGTLVFIGSISYPLYLIHQNIGFLVQLKLIQWLGVYSMFYVLLAIIIGLILALLINKINNYLTGLVYFQLTKKRLEQIMK